MRIDRSCDALSSQQLLETLRLRAGCFAAVLLAAKLELAPRAARARHGVQRVCAARARPASGAGPRLVRRAIQRQCARAAARAKLPATPFTRRSLARAEEALIELFKLTNGPGWTNNDGWDPDGGADPCDNKNRWYGVGCIDPCDIYRDGPDCAVSH